LEFKVTNDKEKWNVAYSQISNFPGKIYYSYDYLSLCENTQDGSAFVAIGKVGARVTIFYPFMHLYIIRNTS